MVLINFGLFSQNNFYLRCVDAENLDLLLNVRLEAKSKRLIIEDLKNGLYRLTNFKKGAKINLTANDYVASEYTRPDARWELAMKFNGEKIYIPGDTIVVEMTPNEDVLKKRWAEEDKQFPIGDTTNLEKNPDTKPSFINEEEFNKIMNSTIHFPRYIADEGYQGTVYISAILESDGTLTNFAIRRGIHSVLDHIALRAARNPLLPKMNPASKNNETVRFKILIPVYFRLQ